MSNNEYDWDDTLLYDYLEDELDLPEQTRVEKILAADPEAEVRLLALRALVSGLALLPEDAQPARDLWLGIEERLEGTPGEVPVISLAERRPALAVVTPSPIRRGLSLGWGQAVAAGLALALASGAGTWYVLGNPAASHLSGPSVAQSDPASSGTDPVGAGPGALTFASDASADYERASRDLAEILEQGRDLLEPATLAVLESSLAAIDQAIFEARTALEEDPASEALAHMIQQNMNRKLDVLRRAAAAVQSAT